MIASVWQLAPEFRITQELMSLYEETSLDSLGIPIKRLVTFGHPLYTLATAQNNDKSNTDSFFPKIGVEWSSDEIEDDLGRNHVHEPFTIHTRKRLEYYLNRDIEAKDENYNHPNIKKALEGNYKSYQSFTTHVVSEVLISGWGGSGSQGRRIAQTLYMATLDVLPFLAHTLHKKFKATLDFGDSKPSPNVESPDIANGLWGFEILVYVRQIKRTYRFLEEGLISKADVSLIGSPGKPGVIFKPFVGNYEPNPNKL